LAPSAAFSCRCPSARLTNIASPPTAPPPPPSAPTRPPSAFVIAPASPFDSLWPADKGCVFMPAKPNKDRTPCQAENHIVTRNVTSPLTLHHNPLRHLALKMPQSFDRIFVK